MSHLSRRSFRFGLACALALSLSAGLRADGPTVDRLLNEQKYAEALREIETEIAAAKAGRQGAEWAKLVAKEAMIRIGLHGYETAVRALAEREWPEQAPAQAMIRVIYAKALQTYLQSYSWEIRQRERVETSDRGPTDLRTLTADQIFLEATKAMTAAWNERAKIGKLPRAALGEYLSPNTYPEAIRGTLRDSLTYLFVDLLADTTGWTPAQSNDVAALDPARLLGGEKLAAADLPRAEAHPLEKIAYLLADLAAWHRAEGRGEAALEARLELYRRLHANLTEESTRIALRERLARELASARRLPWVSMGYGTLADFVHAETSPDAPARARKIASEGAALHPKSFGAAKCRDIVAAIERPSFSLETMQVDGAKKRSVGVNYRNLRRIHFRSYAFDLEGFLRSTRDYAFRPGWRELETLRQGRPEHEWAIDLEATNDFRTHRAYSVPPAHRPGFYVVYASARPGFPGTDNEIHAGYVFFGDLTMTTHADGRGGALDVEIASGENGDAVPGAKVSVYAADYRRGHRLLATETTDAKGYAKFSPGLFRGDSSGSFLVARKGDHLFVSGHPFAVDRSGDGARVEQALVYTDRAIYRPGQKILWKVVAYGGRADEARFAVAPAANLKVSLRDANGETLRTVSAKTNEFGSASGEFAIPAGKLLGQWSIAVDRGGSASVRVEEYKRPTFEVEFADEALSLRLNREARIVGSAKYYFGLPVAAGRASWTVRRSVVLPWWCFWGGWDWSATHREQIVARGSAPLRADGKFTIAFLPKADEKLARELEGLQYHYRLRVDVTDEGGETRDRTATYPIGFAAVTANLRLGAEFFRAGQAPEIFVARTDLRGKPFAGEGRWNLRRLRAPAETLPPADLPMPAALRKLARGEFRTPDDLRTPRWNAAYSPAAAMREWEDGESVAEGATKADGRNEAALALAALPAGAYRLRYETKDGFGARFETQKEFLVADAKTPVALPGYLAAEKRSVPVGGTIRLLAVSGFANQRMVLETHRAGRLAKREFLVAGKSPSLIEIPVTEADRGGLGFVLKLVRDYQLVQLTEAVHVPWDDKELRLEFATFRDRLRPGAKETWSLRLQAPGGKKLATAAAEVLAYMYDRSLDSFGPHSAPDPLALYPSRAHVGYAMTELGQGPGAPTNSPGFSIPREFNEFGHDALNFYPRYGVGGPGARGGFGHPYGRGMPMVKGTAREEMGAQLAAGAVAENASMDAAAAPMAAMRKSDAGGARRDATAAMADAATSGAPIELRANFAETAFWKPHLRTGADGSVKIEFEVPDSVTSWQVWAHAITKDLLAGRIQKEIRTVKEILVRPYLPRFLREGDAAELKIVVNNTSEKELRGTLDFDLLEENAEGLPAGAPAPKSVLAEFTPPGAPKPAREFRVPAGGSVTRVFPVKAPARVGAFSVRTVARAGDLSDGELRPFPVLPGRFHLAQSRFAALSGKDRRELDFPDLRRNDDPTRIEEQLVLTLDAQLFHGVLAAMPYLIRYPYESTEHTMNRFVSAGVLGAVFGKFPAVAAMAKELSARAAALERWDEPDPNRKAALEETPWLVASRGGDAEEKDLLRVLDPKIAARERSAALRQLERSQTALGGFPWFPGGPPSPHVTLSILYGFSKALEFGVEVPKPVARKAWAYLHRHYVDEIVGRMIADDCCAELVTFLAYVLSNFPDDGWSGGTFTGAQRKQMLDHGFKHWKDHSPYLKGYLALTLARSGRPADAKLVWDSVMDSAKTTPDEGTHWAEEDRSWLWYNDTVETHAFALRAGSELGTPRKQLDGLVQWLFLNKKLNHWKSTRATAEAIYSLTHYLAKTGQLGQAEKATVKTGGDTLHFAFDPARYSGRKNQVVIPAARVKPDRLPITVEKSTPGHLFASATWHYSTEKMPSEARGDFLRVERAYFKRVTGATETKLVPLVDGAKIRVGDEVEVRLSLRAKHALEYVHLRDPRPAGFEPADGRSRHRWLLGLTWYEEIRDSGANFFFERLPAGEYPFRYRIRAATAGTFKASPATVQPMYAPEFNAFSSGTSIRIE